MTGKEPESGTASSRVARTPEARRDAAVRWRERGFDGLPDALDRHVGPGSRAFAVIERVVVGVWQDGFIHAGNLAYMGIIALFPFFVTVAAVFSAIGAGGEGAASVDAFLTALPPVVSRTLAPVAHGVIVARHGWLLWAGGLVGLWTVSSLVETIRDILHRAYGGSFGAPFWRYRLISGLMTVGAAVLLLLSLYAQFAIAAAQQMLALRFPHWHAHADQLVLTKLVPVLVLFGSIYLLFLALTPTAYRRGDCLLWPGAALVTVWWGLVSITLPVLLHFVFTYDLTYGSLAGVMIALFFFWLVGLGMVTGAELNAALAQSPEERDMLGQADNRLRDAGRVRDDRTVRETNE